MAESRTGPTERPVVKTWLPWGSPPRPKQITWSSRRSDPARVSKIESNEEKDSGRVRVRWVTYDRRPMSVTGSASDDDRRRGHVGPAPGWEVG